MEENVFQISINSNYKHAQLWKAIQDGYYLWSDWGVTGNFVDDFIYCCFGVTICKTSVAMELSTKFTGLEVYPVKITKHAKELTCKLSRLRWLPKEEVSLSIIKTTIEVEPLEQSSVTYDYAPSGNRFISKLEGISEKKGDIIIPREKGKGFYFKRKDITTDFFKPKGTGFFLCTQKVKEALDKSNYGSLVLLEVGSIIE